MWFSPLYIYIFNIKNFIYVILIYPIATMNTRHHTMMKDIVGLKKRKISLKVKLSSKYNTIYYGIRIISIQHFVNYIDLNTEWNIVNIALHPSQKINK